MRERASAPPRWRKWLSREREQPAVGSWVVPGGQGVLAVHRLGKGYRGRMVVQDVSLSVRRGEAEIGAGLCRSFARRSPST